jgi:hypothetical protein
MSDFYDNLNVNGDISIRNSTTGNTFYINQLGSGNAVLIEDSASPDLTPFIINSSGNVNIGRVNYLTTSSGDSAKLQVNNSTSTIPDNGGLPFTTNFIVQGFNQNSVGLFTTDINHSQIYFGTPSDVFGSNIRWDYSNRLLNISTQNTGGTITLSTGENNETIRLLPNGYVGIGITTPTEQLDVSGNTKISGSLNIGTVLGNTPIINLGLDSNGNVVTGTTWDGGTNYILVKAQGTDLENAQELQTAYNLAQTFSPLSGNVITIIAAPGYYNFSSSAFTMDTPYIDLVSLDGNRSIIFNSTLNSTSFSDRTEGSISVSGNNISIKGVDVLDKNFTIESNLNSISVENCRGGDYSFGGVEDGDTPIVVSGEFINCIGGDLSFGGNGTASGIFKNCEGADFSFAGAQSTGGIASGRFLDCVGGDESFGFTLLNGEFIDCVGGEFSFGFAGSIEISTFENCVGDNFAFGSFGLIDTTTFENCVGGDTSFSSNGLYIFLSEINNSKGGDFSFGSNIQIILDSEFNNCIGGLDSFGKDFTVSNDGRFYRCRLTNGTFDTPDAGGFIILGIDGDNNVQNITGE